MRKKLLIVMVFAIGIMLTTKTNKATATTNLNICHHNNGTSYNALSLPYPAVIAAHYFHQDNQDIIPPFDYGGSWAGKNWTTEGQKIWANGCVIPPVDCVYHWSDCDKTCGCGTQTLIIDTPAEYGGVACPIETSKPCNEWACEGKCPTACGLLASEVPDGLGGVKQCPATAVCTYHPWCALVKEDKLLLAPISTSISEPIYKKILVKDEDENPEGIPFVAGMNDTCQFPPEVVCPTACGLESSQVADGKGGLKTCEATPVCPVDCKYHYTEPVKTCGNENLAVIIDTPAIGTGKTCPTEPRLYEGKVCEAEGVCPTVCGQIASSVPDGKGGVKACNATSACPPPTVDCKYHYSTPTVSCGTENLSIIVDTPASGEGLACPIDKKLYDTQILCENKDDIVATGMNVWVAIIMVFVVSTSGSIAIVFYRNKKSDN